LVFMLLKIPFEPKWRQGPFKYGNGNDGIHPFHSSVPGRSPTFPILVKTHSLLRAINSGRKTGQEDALGTGRPQARLGAGDADSEEAGVGSIDSGGFADGDAFVGRADAGDFDGL